MSKIEKLSIAVTPEMQTMLHEAVESGEYASTSEVIREALRDWRTKRQERERAAAELGRLWDEGIESGTVDGPTAMKRLRAKVEAMKRPRR